MAAGTFYVFCDFAKESTEKGDDTGGLSKKDGNKEIKIMMESWEELC